MPKIRLGGYIFIARRSDHPPRHVHVYRDGRLVVKWDLDNGMPMKGKATAKIFRLIAPGAEATMKIRRVTANNRRRAFEVFVGQKRLAFPFARLDVPPTADDPLVRVFVDPELGGEGFTYALRSRREGTVHLEDVLEYNQDPDYLRDLLLYRLTLEAQKAIAVTPLSRREIIRRLGTSPPQLYRLLDQTNYRKSIDQLLRLLQALDRDVDLVVRTKSA